MKFTSSRRGLFAIAALIFCLGAPALAQQVPSAGPARATGGGKASWTPAERKIDSNLLLATRAFAPTRGTIPQGLEPQVQSFIDANVAADQTVFVVIKGDVSPDLVAMLMTAGSHDISEFPQYGTITARVPITALVDIAQRSDVKSIAPNYGYRLNRYDPTPEELAAAGGAQTNAGSVLWQGVGAHKADLVQQTGIDGTGVMVCVLSDGVFSLAGRQGTGDLPPSVFILPGQGNQVSGNDEGTAMLEIIHDIAPGASLGFATADPSDVQFATNITGLQANGCNIIVDDVTYFNEGAFQDGIIAQAVNTVTTAGAVYFSSAANSGNKLLAQSGTFEGDFVASAAAVPAVITTAEGGAVVMHSFGAHPYTALTATTPAVSLKWASPLSGSDTTDYDLFVLNSTDTAILGFSNADQTGGGSPFEITGCSPSPCPIGAHIYIVKFAGSTRALRLDTNRGRITATDATDGSTFGHNAAGAALTVASVGYNGGTFLTATPFTGGTGVHVDFFSSDGPRQMFFNPGGTAITPGNTLFGTGGGTSLPKVDITASDCGSTTTPGFTPFCGTSAAAPSAAAIAALIKSAKLAATRAQITTALKNSALDIETVGTDSNSGGGIVMADAAVRNILSSLTIAKSFVPPSIVSGGTSVLTIQVTNPNTHSLAGVAFTDTYPSPQVKNAAVPNAAVSGAGCIATLSAAAAGGTFGVAAATIPALATCTFTVNVTSSTVGGPYTDATGNITTPIALNTTGASAGLTVTAVGGSPPVVSTIVARKAHGAAGTFDLPLTFTTPPTINHAPTTEPRLGPAHQIVFTFDKPLNAATATVTEGTATPSSSVVGSTVVVNLTGVTNQQYVTVSLTNVGSTDGGTGGVGAARIGFLAGDVNATRTVTVADVGLVNAVLSQVVDASNYLKDVNFSGTLSVADKAIANANLTKALPAP